MVELTAGTGTGNDNYAQIGHGGVAGTGNLSGAISVIADGDNSGTGVIRLDSFTDTNTYTLIGHGGRNGDGGTRSGDIFVQASDIQLLPESGDRFAQIGHNSSAANEGIVTPTTLQMIATGTGLAPGAGTDIIIDDRFRDISILPYLSSGGDVVIGAGRDLVNNSLINYSSVGDLTLMAVRNVDVNNSVQNTMAAGGGDVNLLAGWDGVSGFLSVLNFNDCPPTHAFSFTTLKAGFAGISMVPLVPEELAMKGSF